MQQLNFFAKEKVRTNKAQERTNKRAFAVLSCKSPFIYAL